MTDVTEASPAAETPLPSSRSVARLILVDIPRIASGCILLAAVAINVCNVFGRYLFYRPLFWAEEVLMYLIIWGVFISAGSITYQGLHLKMDLLVINVRGKARMLLGGLSVALALACSAFMAVQAFKVARIYFNNGEESITAHFPLVYTHAAILVGFILMFAAAALRIRAYVTGKFE